MLKIIIVVLLLVAVLAGVVFAALIAKMNRTGLLSIDASESGIR